MDSEIHLNSSFKHFYYFVREFNLIEEVEMAPLKSIIDKLVLKERQMEAQHRMVPFPLEK